MVACITFRSRTKDTPYSQLSTCSHYPVTGKNPKLSRTAVRTDELKTIFLSLVCAHPGMVEKWQCIGEGVKDARRTGDDDARVRRSLDAGTLLGA